MLTDTTSLVAVPRHLAALPFLFTALLLIVAQVASRYVGSRLERFVDGVIERADLRSGGVLRQHLDPELQAGTLRQRFQWSSDIVQATVALVAPAASVALLNVRGFAEQSPTVLVVVVAATLILIFLLLNLEPGAYESFTFPRGKAWAPSLVTSYSLVLNLIAATVAYSLAEGTFVAHVAS